MAQRNIVAVKWYGSNGDHIMARAFVNKVEVEDLRADVFPDGRHYTYVIRVGREIVRENGGFSLDRAKENARLALKGWVS